MKNNEDLTKEQGLFSIIDLQHDLPTEWFKATTIKNEEGKYVLDTSKISQLIPYSMQANKTSLKATDIILATDLSQVQFSLNDIDFTDSEQIGHLNTFLISEESLSLDNFKLVLPDNAKDAKQMFMITRMTV